MNRYLNIPTNKSINGKKYFKTTLYPKIEPQEDDYYLYTNNETRLDILANTFYGDKSLYWIISMANNIPRHSIYPPPGTQLRVPTQVNEILNEFNRLNNNR